jgi:hypothetical protein
MTVSQTNDVRTFTVALPAAYKLPKDELQFLHALSHATDLIQRPGYIIKITAVS